MRPLVTIVTVSYNCEDTIGKTMESVLNQDYHPLEYIIIDGASTDKTVSVAESYRDAFEEKGISLIIESEPDDGIYDAMNKGIRMASGDVIAVIGCGDTYEENAVRISVGVMLKYDADVTFADIILHRKDKPPIRKRARFGLYESTRNWNHPTMFAKAKYYKAHPFRGKGIADDYRCYLEMKNEGAAVAVIPKVLAHFEMGGASNEKKLSSAIGRIKSRYLCYRENGYGRVYILECLAMEAAKMLLG